MKKALYGMLCMLVAACLSGCAGGLDARKTALSATQIAGTIGYATVQAHKLTEPGVTPQQDADASAAFARFNVAIAQAQVALTANDDAAFQGAIVQAGMEIATIMQISAATCPVINEGGTFNKDKDKDTPK